MPARRSLFPRSPPWGNNAALRRTLAASVLAPCAVIQREARARRDELTGMERMDALLEQRGPQGIDSLRNGGLVVPAACCSTALFGLALLVLFSTTRTHR